jgi:hypothetical protein
MKTLAITMFFFASALPFVDEPQKLEAPQSQSVQIKRR